MTPADLKVRRESLGLPQSWIAERLGVQDRAVRRWEAGDSPIPEAVDDLLTDTETRTLAWLDATIAAVEAQVDALVAQFGEPASITLTAYASNESLWGAHPDFSPLPASWHRMMLATIRDLIDAEVDFTY